MISAKLGGAIAPARTIVAAFVTAAALSAPAYAVTFGGHHNGPKTSFNGGGFNAPANGFKVVFDKHKSKPPVIDHKKAPKLFGPGGPLGGDWSRGLFAHKDGNWGGGKSVRDCIAEVPLPAAGWMLLVGLGGLGAAGRRRKPQAAG